jgi:hypothetical protein
LTSGSIDLRRRGIPQLILISDGWMTLERGAQQRRQIGRRSEQISRRWTVSSNGRFRVQITRLAVVCPRICAKENERGGRPYQQGAA